MMTTSCCFHLVFPREKFTACFGAAGSAFSLLLVLKFIPKTTKVQTPTTNTKGKKHMFRFMLHEKYNDSQ